MSYIGTLRFAQILLKREQGIPDHDIDVSVSEETADHCREKRIERNDDARKIDVEVGAQDAYGDCRC